MSSTYNCTPLEVDIINPIELYMELINFLKTYTLEKFLFFVSFIMLIYTYILCDIYMDKEAQKLPGL